MAATYSSLVGVAVGGKYEVRKVLGIGGMGVVCEAIHLDLGKKVAIKLIDKTMKESELIVARFRREARVLGQIQSEHIVDAFDVGADARVGLYMVMEHLAGEDLQTRIERDKRVDLTTGVMIAHQVARALAKAHAAGVIHRDLKPANVFLTTRDSGGLLVKLLDFGVSKLLDDGGNARITGSGAPIGTPLYMSPEQAEGKDDTDGRADIWSLGAVLYEALSGAPPFADRGSYHGTIVGILTSRPKLLHDAAPWVPPDLAKVVDAMLVHDREARIKDAATVTQRLLEAYPAVLPDGTGRHTAVIVQQATAPVDAVGDTEVFTSSAFAEARAAAKSDTPRSSDPVAPPESDDEDSKRTLPNVSSSPGVANEATRTAAATPIDIGRDPSLASSSSPPLSSPAVSGITTKVAAPASSARGVAMPGTPPLMDPLPPSEIAPDTMRDEMLAIRAERRRRAMLVVVALAVFGVAVVAFFAGRRTGPDGTPPTTATATAAQPPPPPSVVEPAVPTTPAALVATVVPVASTPPSASASARAMSSASAAPPRHNVRRKPKVAPPSTAPAGEIKPASEPAEAPESPPVDRPPSPTE